MNNVSRVGVMLAFCVASCGLVPTPECPAPVVPTLTDTTHCPHPVAVPLALPRVHTLEQLNAFAIELELAREAERARGDCYRQRAAPSTNPEPDA